MATEKPTPKPIDNPDNGPDIQSKKPDGLTSEESSDKVEIDKQLEDDWRGVFDKSIVFDPDPFGDPTLETEKTIEPDKSIDFDYGDSEDDSKSPSEPIAESKGNKRGEESKNNQNDIEYTYHPNRSYFFIFGLPSTGKTVLLMALYNYLTKKLNGNESFSNINNPKVSYEQLGNELINDFIEHIDAMSFPPPTVAIEAAKLGVPIHLNFKYTPDLNNKPEIEFCLMDMAGEDLRKINFDSSKQLPESIKSYIEDVPQKNLRFIFIIDPMSKKTEQLKLFSAFLNLLDSNQHTNTPVLILVSKWDTIQSYNTAKDYLENEYPQVWQEIRNPSRNLKEFGRFSIGDGNDNENIIVKFDYSHSKNIINWIYKQHTGVELDGKVKNPTPEGSWLKSLVRRIFK